MPNEKPKYKLDPTKLSIEQQKLLSDVEHDEKEITLLGDLADMTQELFNVTDDTAKTRKLQINQIGTLLTAVREELVKLNGKEVAEMPDYAKPIVIALDKLEKKFNVTPEVNVNVPDVHVPALDMKEFNKALKTELPKAFEKAIKLIPTTPAVQLTPLEGAIRSLEEMMGEKLESIDIGTRMKPQFPTSLKVTNPDGTNIGGSSSRATGAYSIAAISETSTYKYFFFEDASSNWYIMRKDLTTKQFDYAKGVNGYITVWTSATTAPSPAPTYASYGVVF